MVAWTLKLSSSLIPTTAKDRVGVDRVIQTDDG